MSNATGQHPEDAHEGCVRVVGGEVRADLVVAHDRQVDQETEHASAHKIPDADRDQVVECPLVWQTDRLAADFAMLATQPHKMGRIEGQQDERHHLHRRKNRGQRHRGHGLPGEIPVVSRADDPAAKKQQGI
jgi:hypothetical protein